MDEKDFMDKLENLQKPEVKTDSSQMQIKLALMNIQKSSFWGVWFLVVPIFFLCCVVMKYLFHWNWGIMDTFIEMMASLDKNNTTRWITPVLFVLLPAIGAVINLLAIMHFVYDKTRKELIVSIRLKWFNIALAVVSVGIVGIIMLYGIMENAHHRAIQQMEKNEKTSVN